MSDLHEAYLGLLAGRVVPLRMVRQKASLRGLAWHPYEALRSPIESTANVFNHVEAAVHGWVPGCVR